MVQICQDDDGELQALGLVDAHEPHAGSLRRAPGGGSLVLLQQPPQLRDEGEEAPVSIALKLLRVLAQGDEILPPGRTIIHGAEDPQHIQSVVDVPDQAVDTHVPARLPQIREDCQEVFAVLSPIGSHSVVVVPGGGGGANLRQPVRREAEQG